MKVRLGISIVFLIALFGLLPPFFSKGGLFESLLIYWDNVFFTMMYLVISFTGIAMPFILPKMGRVICSISSMFGSWFFASFLYELFNFTIPDIVLNNSEDRTLFTKFLIAFIIGLSFTMARETWEKSEK